VVQVYARDRSVHYMLSAASYVAWCSLHGAPCTKCAPLLPFCNYVLSQVFAFSSQSPDTLQPSDSYIAGADNPPEPQHVQDRQSQLFTMNSPFLFGINKMYDCTHQTRVAICRECCRPIMRWASTGNGSKVQIQRRFIRTSNYLKVHQFTTFNYCP
jgi:hypothetical protein